MDDDECPICLEVIGDGGSSVFGPCGHSMHHNCLRQYVLHSLQQRCSRVQTPICCPVCRASDGSTRPAVSVTADPSLVEGRWISAARTMPLSLSTTDQHIVLVVNAETTADVGRRHRSYLLSMAVAVSIILFVHSLY